MIRELGYMSDMLNEEGIKYGDRIIISPFHGKKKTIKINRTRFGFISSNNHKNHMTDITLASVQKERFNIEINQVETINKSGRARKRFQIKTLDNLPFRLNGSLTFEALIAHGDFVELGFHQIHFLKLKEPLEEELPLLTRSNIPILIEGETGVGKTRLARMVHDHSERYGRFVHVNLCAFSPGLIESELFGHVKGAFTGAIIDKKGALKEAHGGTLFLDEIDSLTIEMQTKLLLFLEDKKVRSVGGHSEVKVDTRIICASGQKLSKLVDQGFVRKDFYYRVSSGEHISLQPLRENRQHLFKSIEKILIEHNTYATKELMDYYLSLGWPGNFRQLKGHLEKKVALSKGKKLILCDEDYKLEEEQVMLSDEGPKVISLDQIKKNYAKKAYLTYLKDYQATAKNLGISVKTLKKLVAA